MLHSLALYIMAAEALAYLKDGAGDESTLAKRYGNHPGWIPAFAKSTYDQDENCLFVPLGQCVWKISNSREGDMEFRLLTPRDRNLCGADKMIMVYHLFRLVNEADMRKDKERAIENARLAMALLDPRPSQGAASKMFSKNRNASVRTQGDFEHSL